MNDLKNKAPSLPPQSRRGFITIPFLLVLIIILFFILSFFGLAMTFAHISVTQYMSYSTARQLSLAGLNKDDQQTSAQTHYKRLRKKFFSQNAYTDQDGSSGGWFYIAPVIKPENLGVASQSPFPGGGDSQRLHQRFYGAAIVFQSHFFKFKIPGLAKEDISPPKKAYIMSFLGREPSEEECKDFNADRAEKIKKIPAFSNLDGFQVKTGEGDNGC